MADRARVDALLDLFLIGYMNGPYSRIVENLGFFKAMTLLKRDRDEFLRLGRAFGSEILQRALVARDLGFSGFAVADDIAGSGGLLISFADFQGLLLPMYRVIAATAKDLGLYTFFHCDGDTGSIIDSVIDAGYDCIHPVDDRAGMDLYGLKESYGGRIAFMGHLDCIAWNAARVREEVVKAEEAFSPGGLILGSSGGLPRDTVTDGFFGLYPGLRKAYDRGADS